MTTALELFAESSSEQDHAPIAAAEHILLGLADWIYTQTSLKPMSKTLFFLSRCILVLSAGERARDANSLVSAYRSVVRKLGASAPTDDYSFEETVDQIKEQVPFFLKELENFKNHTAGRDSMGLAFDTLLRGKWEGGEGLGTFLTPEEVTRPMVNMLMHAAAPELLDSLRTGRSNLLFGDICGGTGRFVFHLAQALEGLGVSRKQVSLSARLYDQSQMAVDFGRVNFLVEGISPDFRCVSDSMTDSELTKLEGKFAFLATNPPFGSGKYPWNRAVVSTVPEQVCRELGLNGPASSTDPAALFVIRNLQLLADGGALAIVLPDGVLHSPSFHRALRAYENATKSRIELLALVSLPSTAFALGGTVAKTSFAVFSKGSARSDYPLFVASAKHVGFKKRGNRRIADPAGNDLTRIASEFSSDRTEVSSRHGNWRTYPQLSPASLASRAESSSQGRTRLGELASIVKSFCSHQTGDQHFHVSILDVDETGLIDVIAASRNNPITRSVSCKAGDIIISCLNPKIWRVSMIPDFGRFWTCSGEFLVIRPKDRGRAAELFVQLHHASCKSQVLAMASGTSSSRQRVPKPDVLKIYLPEMETNPSGLAGLVASRSALYQQRLAEFRAFEQLHEGESEFSLGSRLTAS